MIKTLILLFAILFIVFYMAFAFVVWDIAWAAERLIAAEQRMKEKNGAWLVILFARLHSCAVLLQRAVSQQFKRFSNM